MTVTLGEVKEGRRKAENDAQLLANRIALLKQEEERAIKRIEETKNRAEEVYNQRLQNRKRLMEKEEFYKKKIDSLRHAQEHNMLVREKGRENRGIVKHMIQGTKKEEAVTIKKISEKNSRAIEQREEELRMQNNEKNQFIRQKKEEQRIQLQLEKEAKAEATREAYNHRVEEEEILRGKTDALVAKMEKEEMELIQRLQHTQVAQRNAYQELEHALEDQSDSLKASRRRIREQGELASSFRSATKSHNGAKHVKL